MKIFTLLLFTAVTFTSCSKSPTRDQIVRQQVEEHLKAALNDPESYEFVEIVLWDSVLYKDNISFSKEMLNDRIETEERMKKIYNEDEDKIKADANIEKGKRAIAVIDSVEASLGDTVNNVASYTYVFRFRANNAMGAKMLNEYTVQITPSPDYAILNFTNDKDKVLLAPNGFPGYDLIKGEIW